MSELAQCRNILLNELQVNEQSTSELMSVVQRVKRSLYKETKERERTFSQVNQSNKQRRAS